MACGRCNESRAVYRSARRIRSDCRSADPQWRTEDLTWPCCGDRFPPRLVAVRLVRNHLLLDHAPSVGAAARRRTARRRRFYHDRRSRGCLPRRNDKRKRLRPLRRTSSSCGSVRKHLRNMASRSAPHSNPPVSRTGSDLRPWAYLVDVSPTRHPSSWADLHWPDQHRSICAIQRHLRTKRPNLRPSCRQVGQEPVPLLIREGST